MSQTFRLGVFAYNFPHPKTQDFLVRLFLDGYRVDQVFACDPVKLNIPAPSIRTKIRRRGLLHPKVIAERFGVPYHVVPHNSSDAVELVKSLEMDLGVIAGARILRRPMIDAFNIGIINFHPGLIPESRGLDTFLWSVYHDVPLGVTAHLIDEHVDAGTVLVRQTVPVFEDDTVLDLTERTYEVQLEVLAPAIETAIELPNLEHAPQAVDPASPYNRKMPADLEKIAASKIPDYVRRYAQPSGG